MFKELGIIKPRLSWCHEAVAAVRRFDFCQCPTWHLFNRVIKNYVVQSGSSARRLHDCRNYTSNDQWLWNTHFKSVILSHMNNWTIHTAPMFTRPSFYPLWAEEVPRSWAKWPYPRAMRPRRPRQVPGQTAYVVPPVWSGCALGLLPFGHAHNNTKKGACWDFNSWHSGTVTLQWKLVSLSCTCHLLCVINRSL